MTIVCDSNVLISAFLFPGGLPDKIFRAVLAGRFRHATSPDLLTELKKVFTQKFKLEGDEVDALISLISENSLIVYPTERLAMVRADETDNRVLECASMAKAKFLVTGDQKHLLPLKIFRNIQILSPREFVLKKRII